MELEELKNHTVFITGSAQRIGKEIALYIAKYGSKMILHYNQSRKEAEQLLSLMQKYNQNSYIVQADFSREKDIENLLHTLKNEKISILINSASIFPKSDQWEYLHYTLLQQIFQVNLFAPLILIKELLSSCSKGLVINFLDASLKHISTDHFIYRISKYAFEKATLMLAKELAPNIRVNGISPGAILPPAQLNEKGKIEVKNDPGSVQKFYENSKKRIPLNKEGNPDYIVHAVEFIIQNEFLTGVILPVDGGEFI